MEGEQKFYWIVLNAYLQYVSMDLFFFFEILIRNLNKKYDYIIYFSDRSCSLNFKIRS